MKRVEKLAEAYAQENDITNEGRFGYLAGYAQAIQDAAGVVGSLPYATIPVSEDGKFEEPVWDVNALNHIARDIRALVAAEGPEDA